MKNKSFILLVLMLLSSLSNAQTYSWIYHDTMPKISPHGFGGFEDKSFHSGTDFIAPENTEVKAMCSGSAKVYAYPVETQIRLTCNDTDEQIFYNHMVSIVPQDSFVVYTISVVEGDVIGNVRRFYGAYNHIHLEVNDKDTITKNLFTSPHFPFNELPLNTNQAPEFGAFFIRNKNTEEYEKNYVYSKVDIIREVRDNMGSWYRHSTDTIIPDPEVFSGNEYRWSGKTGVPYKTTLSILNSAYNGSIHEYKTVHDLDNIHEDVELIDENKDAKLDNFNKEPRYFFCKILTNSFTPDSTNGTGYDYEEKPWQTKLKLGTEDQEALVNWDAVYPDGNYTLQMTAEDLAGNSTTEDIEVPVDNFLPFHRKVRVYEENTDNLIYDSEWSLNSSGQLECNVAVNGLPSERNLTVEVTTSEPCSNLKYKLGAISFYQNATKINDNTFTFSINAPLGSIEEKLRLKSWDLSGNENYKFENTSTIYPPVYRIGNEPDDWSNSEEKTELQGADECHVLKFINADFYYTRGWYYKNKIYFVDLSIPSEAINSWHWDFDDGHTSNAKNPIHSYEEKGIYDVTLIVNGISLKTKRIEIKVNLDCDETVTAYEDGEFMFGNYYAGIFELSNLIDDPDLVHVIACEEIILLPGFETATGQSFIAEIDYSLESTKSQDSLYTDNNTKNVTTEQNKESLKEDNFIGTINVFPNPSNGQFTIDLTQITEAKNKLEIVNELGSVIYNNTSITNNLLDVDISSKSKGIYFIKLYAENKIYYQKIIYQLKFLTF